MSAHKSLSRVGSFVYWMVVLSVLGAFLYYTGMWAVAFILLELLHFLIVTGVHLCSGGCGTVWPCCDLGSSCGPCSAHLGWEFVRGF